MVPRIVIGSSPLDGNRNPDIYNEFLFFWIPVCTGMIRSFFYPSLAPTTGDAFRLNASTHQLVELSTSGFWPTGISLRLKGGLFQYSNPASSSMSFRFSSSAKSCLIAQAAGSDELFAFSIYQFTGSNNRRSDRSAKPFVVIADISHICINQSRIRRRCFPAAPHYR